MTRTYTKVVIFSKKPKSFLTKGELNNIVLSIKKFDEWLHKSRSGQKISYYRGFLFSPNQQKLSPTLDLNRVKRLADHVRNASHQNLITMVQKRHDNFDYEYFAIRL